MRSQLRKIKLPEKNQLKIIVTVRSIRYSKIN